MEANVGNRNVPRVPEIWTHILSFQDANWQKKARLVSRNWNNLILNNFHKRLRLGLGIESKADIDFILNTVNEKLLSSVRVDCQLFFGKLSQDTMLPETLWHPRLHSNLANLRALVLTCIRDVATICSFFQMVNADCFPNLEELSLHFSLNLEPLEEDEEVLATAGVLSRLKYLHINHWDNSNLEKLETFRAGPVPAALQSLVTATPQLKNLESNIFLDISGRRIKKLKLKRSKLLNEEEVSRMISSVRESLTYLELYCLHPHFHLLPPFPKLSTLKQDLSRYSNPAPKTKDFLSFTFPTLKWLFLQFPWINWQDFPPSGKMELISVSQVPCPHEKHKVPFRLLLNADVVCLELTLNAPYKSDIEDLLDFLQIVNLKEREVNNVDSVLQLTGFKEKKRTEYSKACQLKYLSSIAEKLCRRWNLVKFTEFVFKEKPIWTEKEVPISNGLRKCLITITKISAREAPRNRWNVSCKVRNSNKLK